MNFALIFFPFHTPSKKILQIENIKLISNQQLSQNSIYLKSEKMASVYDYSHATDILSVISDGSNSDEDEVRFKLWVCQGSDDHFLGLGQF